MTCFILLFYMEVSENLFFNPNLYGAMMDAQFVSFGQFQHVTRWIDQAVLAEAF